MTALVYAVVCVAAAVMRSSADSGIERRAYAVLFVMNLGLAYHAL